MTSYWGEEIVYDELGNPLNWINGETLTWQNGRQLQSYNGLVYGYNANGLRVSKTGANGFATEYYVVNGQYIGEVTTINGTEYVISYVYDENGTVAGINVNGTEYYFVKNLQGDVLSIIDTTGAVVANYRYDAYGYLLSVTDANGSDITSETHIANLNPFRYRGYMYDEETGFYYVSSRYYDPEIGRWINADNVVAGIGGEDQGYNPFTYCFNNPVNMDDASGNWPKWIKNAADWFDKKIIKPIKDKVKKAKNIATTLINDIKEDINNYDKNNTSEDKVLASNYFSSYKGELVIKVPIDASFSFGVIGLSTNQQTADYLKHEYGHAVQVNNMGYIKYTTNVFIPSMTINLLSRMDKLPYDYYSYPWEAEANELGGITLYQVNKPPLPEGGYSSYWDLVRLFWE